MPKIALGAMALLSAFSAARGDGRTFADYPRLFLDIRSTFAYAQSQMNDHITTKHSFYGETSADGNVNVLYLKPGDRLRAASVYIGIGPALTGSYRDTPTSLSIRLGAGLDLNRALDLVVHKSILSQANHFSLGASLKVFESHYADWVGEAQIMNSAYSDDAASDVRNTTAFGISRVLRLHDGLRADSAGHPDRKIRFYSQEDPVMLRYVENRTEVNVETFPRRIFGDSMAAQEIVSGIIDSVGKDSVG